MKRKTGQRRPGRKIEPPPRNRKKHGAKGGKTRQARNQPKARKRRGQIEPATKEKGGYYSFASAPEKRKREKREKRD